MYNLITALSDMVGVVGVILILLGYFFVSSGRWKSDYVLYPVLNFVGACLILFSLYFHWNLSSVIIEISWIIISVFGFARIVLLKK